MEPTIESKLLELLTEIQSLSFALRMEAMRSNDRTETAVRAMRDILKTAHAVSVESLSPTCPKCGEPGCSCYEGGI
jgi:hypothetical protein